MSAVGHPIAISKTKARPKKPAAVKPRDRLAWLIDRGHIGAEYLDLGDHLLKLNETRQRTPHPHMHFNREPSGGIGGDALEGRLTAQRKWERLMTIVGAEGEAVLVCVIVEGKTLAEAAKELDLHPKALIPLLRMVLGVLARS